MLSLSAFCLYQRRWLLPLTLVLLVAASVPVTRGHAASASPVCSHVVADPHSADNLSSQADAIYAAFKFTSNNYIIPRGGGGRQQRVSAPSERDSTTGDKHEIDNKINIADHEYTTQKSNSTSSGSNRKASEEILLPLPKRLLSVAKHIVGRTANILFFRSRRQQQFSQSPEGEDVTVDHSFDELDRIIDNTTNLEVPQPQQNQHPRELDRNDDGNLSSWPTLPQGISSLTGGWKQRTFRHWINQMERKFLSSETANALKTIRNIIEKFPDYGVVDLFGMYSPKDVILSIVALSRLQQVLETSDPRTVDKSTIITDKDLLEELAHYCTFANAAYGWKGFAFCGRLHLGGDYRVLARSTGIDRRDIVTAKWHSKANRPAYYIARDVKRKAIVLAIRGSFSPRDLLTDLCASCENFIVEDELEIGEIGTYRNSTTPRLLFGRAHKGMVDAARTIAAMTGKIISEELDAHPDYKLICVGHSLGGGVAAIIAAMWQRRFRTRVRSIGYGNPCVFPLNLTRVFDNVITVEVCGDPFATISIGHLADSTKAISKLCQDKEMRDEILKRLGDSQNISRDDFEWCSNAMMFLRRQMDSEKLYPPGTIYKVSGQLLDFQSSSSSSDENESNEPEEGVTAMITSIDATAFNELKLHARMFDVSLHIPLRYEMLLRRLALSPFFKSKTQVL